MTLRTCLIMMTALAVITDNLIIPFYPQYFAERFDNPPEQHVGLYLAVVSLVVMSVFPLWARLAKRVHPVRILISAQLMAGSLTAACYFIDSLPLFWVVWMKPRYTSSAVRLRVDARALVVLFFGVCELELMCRSLLGGIGGSGRCRSVGSPSAQPLRTAEAELARSGSVRVYPRVGKSGRMVGINTYQVNDLNRVQENN